MNEYQVSLSLSIEATTVPDAVKEFRWDVANGPAYVYAVDDGERLWHFDAEDGQARPAERIDKGRVGALAEKLYSLAHDQPSDADGIAAIRTELYKLVGMV